MERAIAVYVRVSSKKQDTASQEPDIERWAAAFADLPVIWYRDKMTGTTMDRPGWNRLEEDMHSGKIAKVVVWRLDRLGRTAAGLTRLLEEFQPGYRIRVDSGQGRPVDPGGAIDGQRPRQRRSL